MPSTSEIDQLVTANRAFSPGDVPGSAPRRHIAIVTCMDTRIDVLPALGLAVGDAHIIRNAGGRVTDDVLRSLALSTHVLGVDRVVVMQHTKCGLAGVSEEELQEKTGSDLKFLAIGDHAAALRDDIALLESRPYLGPIAEVAGFIYDVDTGQVSEVARWTRS